MADQVTPTPTVTAPQTSAAGPLNTDALLAQLGLTPDGNGGYQTASERKQAFYGSTGMYAFPSSASSILQNQIITGYTAPLPTQLPPLPSMGPNPGDRDIISRDKVEVERARLANEKHSPTPNESNSQDYLLSFSKLDEHNVSVRQADLVKAGLLSPESYRVGDGTDSGTQSALIAAMRVAQLKGISIQEAIDYLKAHPDPNAKGGANGSGGAASADKAAFDAYQSQLYGAYLKTWGINPPPGYIQRAMASHMNVFEFEAHERSKPAFQNSPVFQMERVQLNSNVARLTGRVKY